MDLTMKLIQELFQTMEEELKKRDLAIEILFREDISPARRLYAIYDGTIDYVVNNVDNATILNRIQTTLVNLKISIGNDIDEAVKNCLDKIQDIEDDAKRFAKMSRADMIARIKELEAKEENN